MMLFSMPTLRTPLIAIAAISLVVLIGCGQILPIASVDAGKNQPVKGSSQTPFTWRDFSGCLLPNLDRQSFRQINFDADITYFQDVHAIYTYSSMGGCPRQYVVPSPGDIELVLDEKSFPTNYVKDNNTVYMLILRDATAHVIDGADPESFQVIGRGFSGQAKDKDHLYLDGKVVKDF